MIFITDKKAHELFNQYMDAERKGNDALAEELEAELKEGNWYITATENGLTVVKRDRNLPQIESYYLPQESNTRPYSGDDPKSNRKLWIGIGITASVIALILLTIYLIKRYKNAKLAKI